MTVHVLALTCAALLSACDSGSSSGGSTSVSAPTVTLTLPADTQKVNSRLTFTSSVGASSAYLYVFIVDPAGQSNQLLPNRTAAPGTAATEVGQTITFPPADAKFYVLATGPTGVSTLLAFASTQAINLDGVSSYATADSPFADGKVSSVDKLSAALKLAADAQPGNLYSEARVPLTITP